MKTACDKLRSTALSTIIIALPALASAQEACTTYTVKDGDTLGTIAQAETHSILAEILSRQRKPDEAEVHCRAAVAIATQQMGEDYLGLPASLAALAGVLADQGKLVEARQYAEQAVDICNRHPDQVGRSQQDSAAAALRGVLTRLGSDSEVEVN